MNKITAVLFSPAGASPPLFHSLSVFQSELLRCPHRDLCYLSYTDWFSTYVGCKKSSAAAPPKEKNDLKKECRSIDQLLLSSVFSRRWTEVILSTGEAEKETPTSASHSQAWYQYPVTSTVWDALVFPKSTNNNNNTTTVNYEIPTSSFMGEPLKGGRLLSSWTEACRAIATGLTNDPLTTKVGEEGTDSASPAEALTVVLPFSTLFTIRQLSFQRGGSSSSSGGDDENHEDSHNKNVSLQQRLGTFNLLQSLMLLVEMKKDIVLLEATRSSTTTLAPKQIPFRVVLLTPTQEFDLLCQYPLYKALRSSSNSSENRNPVPVPSLQLLCENEMVRLSYFAHLSLLLPLCQTSSNASTITTSVPHSSFYLLSSTEEHKMFRSHFPTLHHHHHPSQALLSCRESSLFRELIASVTTSHDFPIDGEGGSGSTVASGSIASHKTAMREMNNMVKRVTRREENVRQSFSVK